MRNIKKNVFLNWKQIVYSIQKSKQIHLISCQLKKFKSVLRAVVIGASVLNNLLTQIGFHLLWGNFKHSISDLCFQGFWKVKVHGLRSEWPPVLVVWMMQKTPLCTCPEEK